MTMHNLSKEQVEIIADMLGIAADFDAIVTRAKKKGRRAKLTDKYMVIAAYIRDNANLQSMENPELIGALQEQFGASINAAIVWKAKKAWLDGKV